MAGGGDWRVVMRLLADIPAYRSMGNYEKQ